MSILRIMIVEDDPSTCAAYVSYADKMEDIYISNITNNAQEALKNIETLNPDAVILDLELHLGLGSGLDVLQGLKDLALTRIPYILITTNNSSDTTYNYARQLGADFILYKHQLGYSEKTPLLQLVNMKEAILANHNSHIEMLSAPSPNSAHIKLRISTELDKLGMKAKSKGYKYMVDAIFLLASGYTSHNMYRTLVETFKTSESNIRRTIQYEIDRVWSCADIDDLLQHYTGPISANSGVPTLTELIHYYAERIKKIMN